VRLAARSAKLSDRLIEHSIHNARHLVETTYDNLQLTWDGAQIQARKYMPSLKKDTPQYVDELLGMAEGANVNYTELAVVNGLEAVTTDALHLTKCTSLAVNEMNTADGHVLVAHNEELAARLTNPMCISFMLKQKMNQPL